MARVPQRAQQLPVDVLLMSERVRNAGLSELMQTLAGGGMF